MKYKVYIKVDEFNRIINVNSEFFLNDINGWLLVDEGSGKQYYHAQGYYLPHHIVDDLGRFNYKYENGLITLRTEEEKAADFAAAEEQPTQEERIAALEEALDLLLRGAIE